MRHVYIIRHGKTEANVRHLYHGSTDLDLCEAGTQQLLERRSSYAGIRDCIFVTSGMKRTEQTLCALFGAVPHEREPRFREMDFGSFEMKSYEDLRELPAYQEWISGDNEANVTPGGESGHMLRDRVIEAFEELCCREENVVLVTHGGPIAVIMGYLFPEEEKTRYDWQPGCGGGYLLTYGNDCWSYRKI